MTDTASDERDYLEKASERLAVLLASARADVRIYTRDLDPRVYATEPMLAAARQFLLRGPQVRLDILVQDDGRLRADGNRLIDLLQRLPSRTGVRVPLPEQTDFVEDTVLIDDRIYIRPLIRDRAGKAEPVESRAEMARLIQRFTDLWEFAEPSVEFRHFVL
jgi:hypothetical protein